MVRSETLVMVVVALLAFKVSLEEEYHLATMNDISPKACRVQKKI